MKEIGKKLLEHKVPGYVALAAEIGTAILDPALYQDHKQAWWMTLLTTVAYIFLRFNKKAK